MSSHKNKTLNVGMNHYFRKFFTPLNNSPNSSYLSPSTSIINRKKVTIFCMKNQINHQLLSEMYGNDFAYITEIFSIFLEDIVPDIKTLREEYMVINKEALRNRLHQLKPTFGMVGLEALQKQLEALEKITHDNGNEVLLNRQMELFFKNFTDILPLVKEYHNTLLTHN